MVQDKKRAAMREKSNRGISRRIKKQKEEPLAASSASAMFPAYERVVLREGRLLKNSKTKKNFRIVPLLVATDTIISFCSFFNLCNDCEI